MSWSIAADRTRLHASWNVEMDGRLVMDGGEVAGRRNMPSASSYRMMAGCCLGMGVIGLEAVKGQTL